MERGKRRPTVHSILMMCVTMLAGCASSWSPVGNCPETVHPWAAGERAVLEVRIIAPVVPTGPGRIEHRWHAPNGRVYSERRVTEAAERVREFALTHDVLGSGDVDVLRFTLVCIDPVVAVAQQFASPHPAVSSGVHVRRDGDLTVESVELPNRVFVGTEFPLHAPFAVMLPEGSLPSAITVETIDEVPESLSVDWGRLSVVHGSDVFVVVAEDER